MRSIPVCHIAGAAPGRLPDIRRLPGDAVFAADGGYQKLRTAGIPIDFAVGDFDSAVVPTDVPCAAHPAKKNETDMQLAAEEACERGFQRLYLYGGTGGRPDHTAANLQTLLSLARRGADAFLIGRGFAWTAAENSTLHFPAGSRGRISVFCAGDQAAGVTLAGLAYPLRDAVLTNDCPIGVSNRFTGEAASVSVRCGALLVYFTGYSPDAVRIGRLGGGYTQRRTRKDR